MKIKVLLISETMIDGVGKHLIDLIKGLDREQFDVTVIHSKDRSNLVFKEVIEAYRSITHFYEVASLTREIGFKDLKGFVTILKIIRQIKPDVIHCHSSKAGVLGRVAGKLAGIKRIYYTPHAYAVQNGDLSKLKKWFYLKVEKILGKWFTTNTIHVSKGEADFAHKMALVAKNKSQVIYNGIELEPSYRISKEVLARKMGFLETDFVIGYVARLYHQKNPQAFIKIAEAAVKLSDRVKFVLVGEGEFRNEIEDMINQADLKDRVVLVGYQMFVDDYYRLFDLYLSTAFYEGLPYTIIEAMREGLPCVVSDVIGNNELVVHGVNGYLFPVDDVQICVDLILEIMSDEALQRLMGEESLRFFESFFTVDQMIEGHERLYGGAS